MNQQIRDVIHDIARASAQGEIHFGEVVGRMLEVGVERYHVDYVKGETVYYLGDQTESLAGQSHPVGRDFDSASIVAAIRGAQAGTVLYPEFCQLVTAAGCVGYLTSMVGKRVVYYGRTGDSHVEWFPAL